MQWNTNGTLAEHTPEQLGTVQCLAGRVLQVEHHAVEHKWNTNKSSIWGTTMFYWVGIPGRTIHNEKQTEHLLLGGTLRNETQTEYPLV